MQMMQTAKTQTMQMTQQKKMQIQLTQQKTLNK